MNTRTKTVIPMNNSAQARTWGESLTIDATLSTETRKPLPQSLNLSRAWAKPVPTYCNAR